MKPQSIPQCSSNAVTKSRVILGGVAFLTCVLSSTLSGENINWVTSHGQWNVPTNWTPTGTPSSNSDVYITNGQYEVTLADASNDSWMTINSLTIGATGGTGSRLNINFSDLTKTFTVGSGTISGDVTIGNVNGAPGTLTTTQGNFSALSVTLAGGGNQNTAKGTWNINGGVNTIRATTGGYGLRVGNIGTGILNVVDGELNVLNSAIAIGSNGYQIGQMSVSGGKVNAHTIYVGPGTHANQVQNVLNISGGVTTVNSQFTIGRYANSNGIMTMTDGEFDATKAVTYIGKAETTTNASQGTLTIHDGELRLGLTYLGFNASGKGTWNIEGGTNSVGSALRLGQSADSEGVLIMNDGTLDVSGTMIVGVSGSGSVTLNNGTMTVNSLQVTNGASSTFTFNGGTLVTGGTTVNNGSLFTVGNGTDEATLILSANNHSFANGIMLSNKATLSGTGTITVGELIVSDGSTLSPGNSPGTLTLGDTTLQGGGNFNWQIHDATGDAGIGYDTIKLTAGSVLTLENTDDNPFYINVWSLMLIDPDASGDALNFDELSDYTWTLFSTEEQIVGYSADSFVVNLMATNGTDGFTNAFDGGTFRVLLDDGGTDLVLRYSVIPEPSTFGVAIGIMTVGIVFLRRRAR